jgi:cell division protein FtsW (lipid II flippase)
MLALTLVENVGIIGAVVIFAMLLYLILRPLKIHMTIKHEPPSDEDGIIPKDKED